jgi:hypothetical protein
MVVAYHNELNETNIQFLINDCHADYLMIRNDKGKTAWDYCMIQKKEHHSCPSTTTATSPPNVTKRIAMPYKILEQKRRQQIMVSL